MMRLKEIGHVLLRVRDLEQSLKFYSTLLGFEVMERDPEHGGVFMALPGHAHTLDLFPAPDTAGADPGASGRVGVHHVAFRVDGDGALADAYWSLVDHGVEIVRAVDHVSQKSIYFHDPDGTLLEIYAEVPDARELFLRGRHDRDEPLVFTRPAPSSSSSSNPA